MAPLCADFPEVLSHVLELQRERCRVEEATRRRFRREEEDRFQRRRDAEPAAAAGMGLTDSKQAQQQASPADDDLDAARAPEQTQEEGLRPEEELKGGGIMDRDLPFGHVYDALLACGCRASAPERKAVLGEEFGSLAGVPEQDCSGGLGNIGLLVTVESGADIPQTLVSEQAHAAPDCFIEVSWHAHRVKTKVVMDSWAPVWDEAFEMPFSSRHDTYEELLESEEYEGLASMTVTLYDWNRLTDSKWLGHFDIRPRVLHKVLRFGEPVKAAYTLENHDHEVVKGSQELYRGRQIKLKPTTVTVSLSPLYKPDDPRRPQTGGGGASKVGTSQMSPSKRSRGEVPTSDQEEETEDDEEESVTEVGENDHDCVTDADFKRMVLLLPREEAAEASFSMHAHSHATVFSLASSAMRDMAALFPALSARIAVFARRQQHARIRLQWQDMGSSVVWLRNQEMQRLLLSISKVGMGFAMQKKKMDRALQTMRDARNRAALEARELGASCRPGEGGQVERVLVASMRVLVASMRCTCLCTPRVTACLVY